MKVGVERMHISVSIQDKKDFLKWFIQHHNIEAHEMNWFLEELIDDERALFYVHFVQDIQYCPKGIVITTTETEDVSFLFFKGNVQTEDVYTAYHELQLYQDEAIYVQMNFPQRTKNRLYQTVLEDDVSFYQQTKAVTEKLLAHSLLVGRKNFLEQEINKALENLDYEKFMMYSSQLKEIK